MAIRILHTSDWHFDVSPKRAPRREDHIHLMEQLLSIIEIHKPHILIHAGDIFDRSIISAHSMKLFTGFLQRLSKTSVQDVFIIAGNHDPSAQLDAIYPLLELQNEGNNIRFHLSTALHTSANGDVIDYAKHCTMLDVEGEKIGIAMIPFVSAYYLGVSERSESKKNASIRTKFAQFYTGLADYLSNIDPEAPLVGISHLNCWDAADEDIASTLAPVKIHLGETLDTDTFDARFDYIALGHFHNYKSMDGGRVCYSGSPLPFRRNEVGKKGVVLIEFTQKERCNTFLPIQNTIRESIVIEGTQEDWKEKLTKALCAHENKSIGHTPIPHYVYLKVTDLTDTENQCRRMAQDIANECSRHIEIVSFIGKRTQDLETTSYIGFTQEKTFENFCTHLFNEEYERQHPNKDEADPEWMHKRDEERRKFETLINKWRQS